MNLIQVMKALSDETRLRILNILKSGELCVCELEEILNITQSNVSRHLTKLTNAKILDYYKVTKYVYYRINENIIAEYPFIKEIIEKETIKLQQCQIDYERLKKYKCSGLNCDDLKAGKVCFCNDPAK
ncbi:ArsR family transcriptional regulator [Clostridium pasteurianum DSM 525 = ATCC 6013]|uniref:ArsR family transcriptional regulator n=1 Tax=Clostridium pasteurianum DSM 525 = ATCC 6013 TaxID=1262449 RepID=A0A0H3J1H6_CLOPA|nr:metalloregulator ArsR/SmtB family transcription factor [Clostridium pasteurianum]AJA46587.1 ArsR family transcriptional regulator [Clostridium pasteurianum DSM 525 = ATCC 6013]AJA50575.1 ArsR family transcriptional regulator [Clostridium pasteurianum DSM 525 = ATCC 6013]AOZ74001.1 ArsR family transcriptional regulator [Clostridium pasteurianum DSM 525 = ATCC 6013]AOZ77798.1 ArsR family transcriptional regulator [Clostridium pasteurianum]ELP61153.1 ArsR family transcriptional regulator [Clos